MATPNELGKYETKEVALVNEYPVEDEKKDAFGEYHGQHAAPVLESQVVQDDLIVLSQDVDAVYDRALTLSVEEIVEILEDAWLEHHDDPNFPTPVKVKIEYFLSGDASTLENYDALLEEMRIEAALIRFSSPYPEVRAVVGCHDDTSTPVSTFRVWVIGTIWCGIGSFINQFFSIRTPSFSLTVNEIQILSYPIAKIMEKVLPNKVWFRFRGHGFNMNPGPFNEKEHMLITIMANVGMFAPYTVNVLITQKLDIFYGQAWAGDFGYQILTGLSIQMIGFGFAGLSRRFIVYPEHCIWLFNLSTIALNKSFHDTTNRPANGWKISRMKFFFVAFAAMFIYYWIPGALVSCVSYFNWITWINPKSINVSAVTGGISGLGISPLPSLDWSWATSSNAMIYPFFSTVNVAAGMAATIPIIAGFWANNIWNTGYLPMVSNRIFDNTGKAFNVTKVLDVNKNLDVAKYQLYSQPVMAASNLVVYACFFAVYSATIVHTILYHRKEIKNGFIVAYRSIRAGQKGNDAFKDYHNQAMAKYDEVPELWYFGLTVIAVVFGCIGLTVYPTESSVSCIFFGLALTLIMVIPIGLITSITGIEITLNVFAEFIGGLIYPGKALSMNYFKSYGVMSCYNAIAFAQDLKLAHYMKIPQRHTFAVQIYGAIIATFVSTAVLNWQMTLEDVCTTSQKQHFYCNAEATFFTATVFWGTLGPGRVFGAGGIYTSLLYGFLVGAVLPLPFYFLARKYPKSLWAKVHVVVLISGGINWNPYVTIGNYWPQVVIGWFFLVYIKKKYLAWWSKYNYILATAFASAIPLCGILIFGIISSTSADDVVGDWSVNTIYQESCDYLATSSTNKYPECRKYKIPAVGYFGAAPGSGAWD